MNYDSPEKRSIIVTAIHIGQYDVINLGDPDLAFAPSKYFKVNEMIKNQGQSIIIRKGKTTFAVFPVIHPNTMRFYPPNTFKGTVFSNPRDDIKKWQSSLPSPDTFTILLSHSGTHKDGRYARLFPEIDLIVGGHS